MPLQVEIPGLTNRSFTTIGYHVLVEARPRVGCQGGYRIRLAEHADPEKSLSELLAPPHEGEILTDVALQGVRRGYSFPAMHVQRVQPFAGPLGRSRLIEARYHHTTLSTEHYPAITLQNAEEDLLDTSPLGDAFMFSLRDGRGRPLSGGQPVSEQLLSFAADVLFSGATVVRFVSRRNRFNSWMDAVHQMLNSIAATVDNRFEPFHVDFAPCPLEVRAENLTAIIVEEVYGSFLHNALPPLESVASDGSFPVDAVSAGRTSVASLIKSSRSDEYQPLGEGLTFEVATLVFKAGHYRELARIG